MKEKKRSLEMNLTRLAVVVGVVFWFVESWIDTLFIDEPYLVRLLQPDFNEIWMRLFIIVTIICFGAYAQRVIEKMKEAEENLRLAATVFETATEGITVTDENRRIIAINPAFTEITGYTDDEVIGKNPSILQSKRHDRAFYKEMWDEINTKGKWSGEIWERRKNGEIFPEWLTITSTRDDEGKVIRYTGLFSDITRQKLNEEDIYYRAHYDPLTGLANRLLFSERLSQAMKQSQRTHQVLALFFIDLDRFKHVNDTLGHSMGDYLLQEAAKRLQSCVKEDDSVARSGGDEFLILFPNIEGREDAEARAMQMIKQSAPPFHLKGHDAFVSASIGITMFPADGEDVSTLLKNADMAMYQAKDAGRNTFKFFNRSMAAVLEEHASLEWDLRRALERKELGAVLPTDCRSSDQTISRNRSSSQVESSPTRLDLSRKIYSHCRTV